MSATYYVRVQARFQKRCICPSIKHTQALQNIHKILQSGGVQFYLPTFQLQSDKVTYFIEALN